jgi:hypothetical protein
MGSAEHSKVEHGFRKKNLCISLEFTTGNLAKKKEKKMK